MIFARTIYTWRNLDAPRFASWSAAWQEPDLDVLAAHAATEDDAIADLVTQYDIPKGESR
jgi:hypothetical protein